MKSKKEMIDVIAQGAEINKKQAEVALNVLLGMIVSELQAGESVTLQGVGVISVAESPERPGRNPKTGESIMIQACKKPKFKASKTLKDALN